jgi:hypothetical protein
VRLTVLGGQLTPDTSFWSGGKVSTRAAASFVDFVSRYAFITPEGNKARVALGEIAETGDVGELVNTTSDGTKTVDAAKNVGLVALNVLSIAGRLRIGISMPLLEVSRPPLSGSIVIFVPEVPDRPVKPAPARPLSVPVATWAADVCRSGGHRHEPPPTSGSVRLVPYHAMRWSNS